jgi:hypothetical protein
MIEVRDKNTIIYGIDNAAIGHLAYELAKCSEIFINPA